MTGHHELIATALSLSPAQVQAVADLLDGGATVPFTARYRKEATSSLDEVAITAIRDQRVTLAELDKRRTAILRSLADQGIRDPTLERRIAQAPTRTALEDLYLPYRPRRKTRASTAKEQGLQPLAEALLAGDGRRLDAKAWVDPTRHVTTPEAAWSGARDIVAEGINEDADARAELRRLFRSSAQLKAKVIAGKRDEASKFKDYFDWSEALHRAPSHRVLAILRGHKAGVLSITARPDQAAALGILERRYLRGHALARHHLELAIADAYKRLLRPSLEKELLQRAKARADQAAINVFSTNLREVLMAAPLGHQPVLAIDPGYRTGAKVVALDAHGNLLHHMTVFIVPAGPRQNAARVAIEQACTQYSIEAIAVGNGTAGRETEQFIRSLALGCPVIAVDESGASIYSASQVARDEFPDLDLTIRGAISIGRRLQDPLAELVKLDPQSIGVGQYQHDVDQRALAQSLAETIHSTVSAVGVDLNSASIQLLTHVAGLGNRLATEIVKWRTTHGPFPDRASLKHVPRLGERAFELAAGFLRIPHAAYPLDASAVHPERYALVETIARDQCCSLAELLHDPARRAAIELDAYITDDVGRPTLEDIIAELGKPGRDPRPTFEAFSFADVHRIEDLRPGMVLPGIITNVTNFGAFVDVGVHHDGLVHISQLSDRFVRDPNELVKVRQRVRVTVTTIDLDRKRIGLSMRSDAPTGLSS